MKLRTVVFLQVALLLLLLMCIPAVAGANTADITLSLNKTAVSVGDSVIASGKTAPSAWVPLKVIDKAWNILVFDARKADVNGNYSIDFIVPSGASGKLTVVVGEGSKVAAKTLSVGSAGSGGRGGFSPTPVTSTTGSATVPSGTGGIISLGSEAAIKIPAGALTGTGAVEVKIAKVSTPPSVPAGFKLLGDVYEFSVGGKSSYNFTKNVTITLSFDSDALGEGETPAIHYYDETGKKWVNIGGEVSGNTISVEVDHLTKYAVMAAEKLPQQLFKDTAGHWAENNIKELVELGAIGGYPDGTFRPDNRITRAEFATILVKAFKLEPRSGKVFADTAGHWAEETISTAASYGIVSGYSAATFGPDDPVTREQMAVMIVKAAELAPGTGELSFKDGGKVSGWAREAVVTAVQNGIINGYPDNTVRPQGNATRAEAVTVIVNALRGAGE